MRWDEEPYGTPVLVMLLLFGAALLFCINIHRKEYYRFNDLQQKAITVIQREELRPTPASRKQMLELMKIMQDASNWPKE